MIALQTQKQVLPHRARRETNSFLFIASDWRGAMLWPGGIASYIDSLARGLMSLGDSVKLLAVVRPDEEVRTETLEKYGPWAIPFKLIQDDKPTNLVGRKFVSLLEILRCLSPACRRRLRKSRFFEGSTASIAVLESLLLKEKPTAIVFGNLDARLYPVALSLLENRRPYGIIAHGCEIARSPSNKMHDLALRGMMLRRASWIAANSSHTKSLLDAWRIPPDRVDIIYPPISEEAMRESAVSEATARKDDDLSIVTICRLVKGKGVDLALRALANLGARGVPYRYTIGGDGPERGSLEALVDKLGLRDKVHFRGSVEGQEKWRLLRDADVFVMPSRFEPSIRYPWQESFGIAFAEAAAFGLPAIGSRSGGIPEAVVDGETGILVPEESHVELADALTLLYREPEIRREMGRVGRERARRQFSPTAVALQFREEVSEANLRSLSAWSGSRGTDTTSLDSKNLR
jgi:glycosyltransferase involved in cell wall biosynthesis